MALQARKDRSTINILLVSNGYPPMDVGGVEVYTASLAKGLADHGHQVTVFARASSLSIADYTQTDEDIDSVRVLRIVNDHKKSSLFYETFADPTIDRIFESILSDLSPDVVHFNHLISLSARLPALANQHNVPSVITLHDHWPICHRITMLDWQYRMCGGPKNGGVCHTCVMGGAKHSWLPTEIGGVLKSIIPIKLRLKLRQVLLKGIDSLPAMEVTAEIFEQRYALFRKSLLQAQRILVPSNYLRSQFAANGYPEDRFEVLPLGIELDIPKTPANPSLNTITFATIGSIMPAKGIDILVKAFMQVDADHIRLDILGQTPAAHQSYVKELKQMAQADRRIHFKGPFDPQHRGRIFEDIDILVIPSRMPETFSLVAREALLYGKPVIGSRNGALPEIISEGENGFLFSPEQTDQLEAIIRRIARNPNLLSELTCPGPVPIITLGEHIASIEKVYRQVLAEPVRAGERIRTSDSSIHEGIP
jgi:glycosyltransferase involved in cell wall biosynthesis